MPISLSINDFDPMAWVNEYIQATPNVDATTFEPILLFALMWNLFERDACARQANPASIQRSVLNTFSKGKLALDRFQEHLNYFRTRAQSDRMTIDQYLHQALRMRDASAKQLVKRVLASELNDPNNVVSALLLIAHRIRNNLFHGEKEVAHLNSQVDLFRCLNSLLATYLSVIQSLAKPHA